MKKSWLMLCGSVCAWTLSVALFPAQAQETRPGGYIRMVLSAAAGGGSDNFARRAATKLSTQLDTSVVVENRTGANGAIAVDYVAKSPPDGRTMLLTTISPVLSVAMGEKLPYDLMRDLAPVVSLGAAAQWLVVHASVPVNNPAQFAAYLKANPGKLAYSSAGTGNITHLGVEMMLQAAGVTAIHVPYKGGSPMVQDLLAGRVQFSLPNTPLVVPLLKDKRIKVIGITSPKHSKIIPDVPTLGETLMPGFGIMNTMGVMVTAQTPTAAVNRLNGEFLKLLRDPEVKQFLERDGFDTAGSSPQEYGALLRTELDKWTKLIKSMGIKPE